MDASQLHFVSDALPEGALGAEVLASLGYDEAHDGLFTQVRGQVTIDATRPAILVPTSRSGPCITNAGEVRKRLKADGVGSYPLSTPTVDGYDVYAHSKPSRRLAPGSAVICLKSFEGAPASLVKSIEERRRAQARSVTAATRADSKPDKRRDQKKRGTTAVTLQDFLDEEERRAAAEAEESERTALPGVPQLLKERLPAVPVARKSRREEPPANSSGGDAVPPSSIGHDWGESFRAADGTVWFKPHPHVFVTQFSPEGTVPAHDDRPVTLFTFDGCLVSTSIFRGGPEAFSLVDGRVPVRIKELAAGQPARSIALVASYPAVDGAAPPALDDRLGRFALFWKESLAGSVPLFVAVAVAALSKRSEYCLPRPGLWEIVRSCLGTVAGAGGSVVVGSSSSPTDDEENSDIARALAAPIPTEFDSVFAREAGLSFVPIRALLDDGAAALP